MGIGTVWIAGICAPRREHGVAQITDDFREGKASDSNTTQWCSMRSTPFEVKAS
jgi:hypothetical protein